jgi:hypothetical protein
MYLSIAKTDGRGRSLQDHYDAKSSYSDESADVQQSRVGSNYTSDGAHLSIIGKTTNRPLGVLLLTEI